MPLVISSWFLKNTVIMFESDYMYGIYLKHTIKASDSWQDITHENSKLEMFEEHDTNSLSLSLFLSLPQTQSHIQPPLRSHHDAECYINVLDVLIVALKSLSLSSFPFSLIWSPW